VRFSKYRAQKTDGYASKKEARRAGELKLMQSAGVISDLREQVTYEILPSMPLIKCPKPLRYIADFAYKQDGVDVVEDVKGFKTREYRIKRRLMLFVHKIVIKES
jgi:hypothetical protein